MCLPPDEEPGKVKSPAKRQPLPRPAPAPSLRPGMAGKGVSDRAGSTLELGWGWGKLQAKAEGQVAHSVLERDMPLLSGEKVHLGAARQHG